MDSSSRRRTEFKFNLALKLDQFCNYNGVNEIKASKTLGNVSISEISSLVCRILESNGALQNPNTVGPISSIPGQNWTKLTPPMDSGGPKSLDGTINSAKNITLDFVPKCTQTEAVCTAISG